MPILKDYAGIPRSKVKENLGFNHNDIILGTLTNWGRAKAVRTEIDIASL